MYQALPEGKELLSTDDVAGYLEVSPTTVWRWCREGDLPCMKIARSWRIRRDALDAFLEKSERSETLVGRLRPFLEMPDNVLAIAQNREIMYRLDAAFFRIGAARGALMVKYELAEPEGSTDEIRTPLERHGLEVSRLEEEGRLRFVSESEPAGGRVEELERLASEATGEGRPLWVNFNWEKHNRLEEALKQQEEITRFVEDSLFVVKTTILEEALDEWPGMDLRRAQVFHSGTIWLSESGLALSRVTPPPTL
ncbi:MAG: helix-turn-helix domain-containing protein [Actinomycetota bacterium]|nr:helix-turn-helix domain-containing protein [Actinomycetota bacterium]